MKNETGTKIMTYRGFDIKKSKWVEGEGISIPKSFWYLCYTATCGTLYKYCYFKYLDMQLYTEEDLLKIFINSLDRFINELDKHNLVYYTYRIEHSTIDYEE